MPVHFHIDSAGWCGEAVRIPSPNFDARPAPVNIDLLVIHNISLPPGQFGGAYVGDLFTNRLDCSADPYFDQLRSLRVSSHFFIPRGGNLVQFVSADERAWHAGVSCFNGRARCNDFSIGIELEGTDFVPFEEIQYEILAALTYALQRRYSLKFVTGHEHIAPGRKTDPGPFFDWAFYQEALKKQVASMPDFTSLSFPDLM
jgi:AmpD protein